MAIRYTATTILWATIVALIGPNLAVAQQPKVQADLISAVDHIQPGVPFTVGLSQRITPHWHTYWKNPGDSGEPTRIEWSLPDGFKASEIRWPVPDAIPVGPLVNYGYSDTVLLPVTITPPETLDTQSVELTAKANWLVCEQICIPESAELKLILPVTSAGEPPTPSEHADHFAETERSIPTPADWPATVEQSSDTVTLKVAAPELDPNRVTKVEFFPDTWGLVDHAGAQKVSWTDDGVTLNLKSGELASNGIKELNGVLVLTEQIGNTQQARHGFTISAKPTGTQDIAATGAATPLQAIGTPSGEGDNTGTQITIWQAMLFALLGGIILNLMPCVLPILSLKTLSLAQHSGSGGSEARRSGLAYLAGVLASFAILTGVLVALRSAGLAFGWGFQFQSPVFVLALAALFLALGLSLSGVFDIGGGAVGLGEGLTRKSGLTGSFFTGVLATVAATPCTAPFMGAAIGYALTRPALDMALVLQAIGVGFALPILLISLSPAACRIIPKPGPWMDTFKQVLAFPLYATVVWLVWVLSLQAGSDGVLSAGVTLIAVGFAAWLLGNRTGQPALRGALAVAAVGAALAFTVPWITSAEVPTTSADKGDITAGEPFSEERVAELRASGRPVFVNFTAAWCISCKVNEQVALRTDGFRKALTDHNVAYLKGDWTNQDERISRVLKAYGRAGVPLYLLYPADPQEEAIVLPQLLTEAIVVRHFAELNRTQAAIR